MKHRPGPGAKNPPWTGNLIASIVADEPLAPPPKIAPPQILYVYHFVCSFCAVADADRNRPHVHLHLPLRRLSVLYSIYLHGRLFNSALYSCYSSLPA